MQHKQKLNTREKFKACLDLSSLVFNLMKNSLKAAEFERKLKRLRAAHLENNFQLLKSLGKLSK